MASYYVGYITIKNINECYNIKSVNLQYLMTHRVTGHIGEKNGSNYLVLPPDNKLMNKHKEVWGKLKMRLKQLIMIKNLSTTKIS